MSPKRGTVSVNAGVYDRLQAYCEANHTHIAALVERLVDPVLSGAQPIPMRLAAPSGPVLDRETLDRLAADRQNLALLRAALPTRATGLVALDIPAHVSSALFDRLERERAAGSEVGPGLLLEQAIERMLTTMERVPWCRTCLEFFEHCGCRAVRTVAR